MDMNLRETWTVVHGMVFGFIFLLGFSGALYMVYSMKPQMLTAEGLTKTANAAKVYVWGLAISVWAAVFTGAWSFTPGTGLSQPMEPPISPPSPNSSTCQ